MSNQTIQSFVAENAKVNPNADIQERWASRVEANGLNMRGAAGADSYIGQYGKGIKSPKVVMFARMAEIKGFPEMAARFWEIAFHLATGLQQKFASDASPVAVTLPTITIKESFKQSPMLLTKADLAEAMRMAGDPTYVVQEKMDGRRLLTRAIATKTGVTVTAGNKKGLSIIPSLPISDAVARLKSVELDGEDVNGVYYVFDILSLDGKNLRNRGYMARYTILKALLADQKAECANLKLVPVYVTRAEKLAFIEELEARKAEGFVLKLADASYVEGESDQRKYQFRALNTFIVGARNGEKDSVQISVHRADGSLRDMGFLTVPANRDFPTKGTVLEVEYLYCHTGKSGKLHQPVFKEVRDDAAPEDCQEVKLKVKAEVDDE